jgi:hypothetical protein
MDEATLKDRRQQYQPVLDALRGIAFKWIHSDMDTGELITDIIHVEPKFHEHPIPNLNIEFTLLGWQSTVRPWAGEERPWPAPQQVSLYDIVRYTPDGMAVSHAQPATVEELVAFLASEFERCTDATETEEN